MRTRRETIMDGVFHRMVCWRAQGAREPEYERSHTPLGRGVFTISSSFSTRMTLSKLVSHLFHGGPPLGAGCVGDRPTLRCRRTDGVSFRRRQLTQARRTCVRNQPGGSAGRSVRMPWRRQIRWTAAAVQRICRISGAATRWRYGPFQRAGDAAEGPAENPAAPNQQHHLVIMLADQLAHPLPGRPAAKPGVDLPASWHDSRHDTTPAGPG